MIDIYKSKVYKVTYNICNGVMNHEKGEGFWRVVQKVLTS